MINFLQIPLVCIFMATAVCAQTADNAAPVILFTEDGLSINGMPYKAVDEFTTQHDGITLEYSKYVDEEGGVYYGVNLERNSSMPADPFLAVRQRNISENFYCGDNSFSLNRFDMWNEDMLSSAALYAEVNGRRVPVDMINDLYRDLANDSVSVDAVCGSSSLKLFLEILDGDQLVRSSAFFVDFNDSSVSLIGSRP